MNEQLPIMNAMPAPVKNTRKGPKTKLFGGNHVVYDDQ